MTNTSLHACKTLYLSTTCVQKGKGGKGKKAPPRKEDTIETLPEGTDTSFPTEVNPEAKTADGRKFTLKIASWNLNGIRAWYDVSVWIVLTENKSIFMDLCFEHIVFLSWKSVNGHYL